MAEISLMSDRVMTSMIKRGSPRSERWFARRKWEWWKTCVVQVNENGARYHNWGVDMTVSSHRRGLAVASALQASVCLLPVVLPR
nr:hypothetical protein [uncultured Rhodopila sp.]